MAGRVELDHPEQGGMSSPPQDAPPGLDGGAGPVSETRTSLRGRFRNILRNIQRLFKCSEIPFDWKSIPRWRILISAGAALVLVTAGAVSYVLFQRQEATTTAVEQKNLTDSAVPLVHEAAFTDFIIGLQDMKGHYRFLQCDVTVVFHENMELTEDRKVEVRRAIYLAAKKKGSELIGVSDSGGRFKGGVRDELRNLFGEGKLKDVYITRYVLI